MTSAASLPPPVEGPRPGDIDLSHPKTFLAGVPHGYFRVLRERDPVHWQDGDAIERDLAKRRPFCFPTVQTKLAQVMRRFAPGLVWSMVHRVEGR